MSQNRVKVGELWKTAHYGIVFITEIEDCQTGACVRFTQSDGTKDSFTGSNEWIHRFFEEKPPKIIFKQGSFYLRHDDGQDVLIPRYRFRELEQGSMSVCDDSCDCDDEDDDDDDEFECGIEDLDDCCECGVEGACQNLNIAARNVTIHVSNYYDGSVAKSE